MELNVVISTAFFRCAVVVTATILRPFVVVQKGKLCYFALEDWSNVCELDHSTSSPSASGATVIGIRKLFADASGCRVVYVDDKAEAFLYCPVCMS